MSRMRGAIIPAAIGVTNGSGAPPRQTPSCRLDPGLGKTALKRILFDRSGRLRNGWWILVFVALFILSRGLYTPVSHALQAVGVSKDGLSPLPFLFVLLVTWACTWLRRQPLASVGLHLDRRWFGELLLGSALGMASMAVIAVLIWVAGGVSFVLDPARSVMTLAFGLYVFLFVALFEEGLFRGFLFQRLIDGIGAPVAIAATALLFALGHGDNPGMQGATRAWATGDLALGAIVFGLAYLRTGSLALPVGLHLGWNWMQGHVLGFGVSGIAQNGWLHPVFQGRPEWLSGGVFGPESSVCAVIVDLIVIAILWRWRGNRSRPAGFDAEIARLDKVENVYSTPSV